MIPKCKYCKIDLTMGSSIDTIEELKYTFTPYSEGKLVKCWKCSKCGYSEDFNGHVDKRSWNKQQA